MIRRVYKGKLLKIKKTPLAKTIVPKIKLIFHMHVSLIGIEFKFYVPFLIKFDNLNKNGKH